MSDRIKTHRRKVLGDVGTDDASRSECEMSVDPEDLARTRMAAEVGDEGDGSIDDGTHAPVDGDDERHAFLITTQ